MMWCMSYIYMVPLLKQGAYNATSVKPLLIWGSHSKVKKLEKRLPMKKRKHMDQLAIVDEFGRINGSQKKLKQSQTYTPEFGKAVAKLFKEIIDESR